MKTVVLSLIIVPLMALMTMPGLLVVPQFGNAATPDWLCDWIPTACRLK